jgi:predicted house-cleaning noncanonical NTP pyrophosphatase (MazG superfamily)
MEVPVKRVYYKKLIRDGVVGKMKELGVAFKAEQLTHEKYLAALLKKVPEEASAIPKVAFVSKKQLMEEIADLELVLDAIKKEFHIDPDEFARVRADNLLNKGGFDGRHFLVWSQKEGYTSNEES